MDRSSAVVPLLLLLCRLAACDNATTTTLVRCVKPELRPCYCGKTIYDRQLLYAVNCTGTALNADRSLDVFVNLPDETEVLIFTGNFLPELPSNLFGVNSTMEKLRFLDMSNNEITEIKGKSYHRVSAVERLILNNNKIKLNVLGLHHPRVFSNFENLIELHLTDAFADIDVVNITTDLYNIFKNSNLSRLAKLHLEQNKMNVITEPYVFCPLPHLLDLHLSNNKLTGIDFNISCIPNLRFIDLEGNYIRALSNEQLSTLDNVQSRNGLLAVDLSNNLFLCDCNFEIIDNWLRNTNVSVRNPEMIRCILAQHENPLDPFANHDHYSVCPSYVHTNTKTGKHGHKLMMLFVSCAVFGFLGIVLYVSRFGLKRLRPEFTNTISRKIHYTTIDKTCEEQEIHV